MRVRLAITEEGVALFETHVVKLATSKFGAPFSAKHELQLIM
jgi:hypothetical protein